MEMPRGGRRAVALRRALNARRARRRQAIVLPQERQRPPTGAGPAL
jgi:hypothetical protein